MSVILTAKSLPLNRLADPKRLLSWLTSRFRRRTPPVVSFEQPFCFLHIPKTAGMTVRQFLMMRFPPGQAYNVPARPAGGNDLPVKNEDLYELHQRRPHLAYISHVPYRWLRNFPRQPHLFTILREPIDRVLSQYYFLRDLVRQGQILRSHPFVEQIVDVEIDEFVRSNSELSQVFFGEAQTRWLAGNLCWDMSEYEPRYQHTKLSRWDLWQAKRRLRRCAVVGLAHRLLDSLQLLCKTFDWPSPAEVRRENTTEKRPKVDQLDPQTLRLLETITAADRELFAEGNRLFERRMAEHCKLPLRALPAPTTWNCNFDRGVPGSGWFAPEPAGDRWYCWMEQSAWLEFRLQAAPRLAISVEIHCTLDSSLCTQLEVWFNGRRLETTVSPATATQKVRIAAFVHPRDTVSPPARNRLTFKLPRTIRPSDIIPGHTDTRDLGLAISSVSVEPLSS